MNQPDLLAVCLTAFASVFVLLALLAGVIRIVTFVFPARPERGIEPALVAAVAGSVAVLRPGARVTTIVEER